MNILLLCDRKSADNGILNIMQDILSAHKTETFILSREKINPCQGCFGCWLRTPGKCVITNDAGNSLASKEVNADALVLVSEITYGGFSSDVKACVDRMIQNVLPLFEMYKGEMHHVMRYERIPTCITVGYSNVCDDEKRIFTTLADRNALNMRPDGYVSLAVKNGEELAQQAKVIFRTLGVGV